MHDSGVGQETKGDEDFVAFFDEFFMRARRVAFRIVGEPFLAEDLALEAFIRLYVRWASLRSQPRRTGWVMRVTANLAIDATRRRPAIIAPAVVPDLAEAAVLRLALAAALSELSSKQRSVISLRYLADLSEEDVAVALGISRGSVKTHAHRALSRLRRLLPDYEVEFALDHS